MEKINKRQIFLMILIILAIFLLTRLLYLTKLPIFTDEAIYIRWSQIGSRDANWRFISLTDGKQPFFTWVMMILFKILPADPLFIGRLVSVFSGAFTLAGIWLISKELFKSSNTAIIASWLYILMPFTLIYDRLALYDSMVSAFFIWSLYLSVQLVKHLRLDIAMVLGMVLGGSILNKSSGFLNIYLLPSVLLLLNKVKNTLYSRLIRFLGLGLVAVILALLYYSILRLSPFFHMVGLKNTVFVYSVSEWFKHPFTFFHGNIKGLFDWLIHYLTWPVFICAFTGIFIFKNYRQKVLLYIWWLAPFILLSAFGRVLYPRFILFMSIPLLILAGDFINYLIHRINNRIISRALILLIFIPGIWISYFIITNPVYANIPLSDKGQLLDDWPAGGGVVEAVTYLKKEARSRKITVFTEGTFGLLPYAIEIYLVDNPNVEIKGIWPLPLKIPKAISKSATNNDTYLILNQTQKQPLNWNLTLIDMFRKGNRTDRHLRLFKVNPQTDTSSKIDAYL